VEKKILLSTYQAVDGRLPFFKFHPGDEPMTNCDRCHEDRAYCHSCPEQCFPDDKPMEAKEPTPLDRIAYGLSQWVTRIGLPELLTKMGNVMQHRVKKNE
jgi:hypothetical protein